MLALDFMQKHSLPESYFEPLVDYVSHTQAQLIRESIASAEAAGSRLSSPSSSPVGKGANSSGSTKKVSPTKETVDSSSPPTTITKLRTSAVAIELSPTNAVSTPPLPAFEDSDLDIEIASGDDNEDNADSPLIAKSRSIEQQDDLLSTDDFYPPPPPPEDDEEGEQENASEVFNDEEFTNLSALPTEDEFYQPFGEETPSKSMSMSFDSSALNLGNKIGADAEDSYFFEDEEGQEEGAFTPSTRVAGIAMPEPPPSPPPPLSTTPSVDGDVSIRGSRSPTIQTQDDEQQSVSTKGDDTNKNEKSIDGAHDEESNHHDADAAVKTDDGNGKDDFEMIVDSHRLDESEIESVDIEVDLSALEDSIGEVDGEEDDNLADYADEPQVRIPSSKPNTTSNPRIGSGRFQKLFEQFADHPKEAADAHVHEQQPKIVDVNPNSSVTATANATDSKQLAVVDPNSEQPPAPVDKGPEKQAAHKKDPLNNLNYSSSCSPVPITSIAATTPIRKNADNHTLSPVLSPSFQLKSLSQSPFPVDKSIGNEEIG